MYNLKLIKNDFSPLFHLVHGIKQVCGINTALATKKANAIINQGETILISGKLEVLLNLQRQFSERGILTSI